MGYTSYRLLIKSVSQDTSFVGSDGNYSNASREKPVGVSLMSSWVTHLCKGFEGFFCSQGGLTTRGTFFLVHW